jgi:hypothetical protein
MLKLKDLIVHTRTADKDLNNWLRDCEADLKTISPEQRAIIIQTVKDTMNNISSLLDKSQELADTPNAFTHIRINDMVDVRVVVFRYCNCLFH